MQSGRTVRALATLAVPAFACLPLCGQEAYRSNAKCVTEADAEARATAIDVGTAEFVGPSTATVGDYGSFRLRFTVGEAGMAIGGGLRLATQHDFGWDMWGGTRLQEDAPAQPNFLTYSTSTGSRLSWRSDNSVPAYFPWQRVNQFILEGPVPSRGGLDRSRLRRSLGRLAGRRNPANGRVRIRAARLRRCCW